MKRVRPLLLFLGLFLFYTTGSYIWSQDPKPGDAPKAEASPAPEAKPDPSGGNTGDAGTIITDLDKKKPDKLEPEKADLKTVAEAVNKSNALLDEVAAAAGKNRVYGNMMWTLITGFLVMFMQAGFALVETGLTRGKNVAHTMAMNIMIYGIGILGFWAVGFALMYGGFGSYASMGNGLPELLNKEYSFKVGEKEFGLFGYEGFFLTGRAFDAGILTLFLFQMVFMDTAATIPTGALAERWKFLSFCVYGLVISTIIYPVYGNWVWGGGWLSKLGVNFELGHGHVDFAGSSVVHMVGGLTALAGAWMLGPRIGKYNTDGSVNALPAHNVPMYVLGTLILAFGWFGFNPGSTQGGADLNIGRIAANTMLASAAGAVSATIYMWTVYKKPDPSFMCNGMLAGLVGITAPCAFVAPWAAVVIGLVAGVLVIWACLFVERVLKVDDPVGAVGVHGINGAWGILAVGLFADGTYGQGQNGANWYKVGNALQLITDKTKVPAGAEEVGVTGLFYGSSAQLVAECIGIAANVLWVIPVALLMFKVMDLLIGNRVSAEVELAGLDVHEMGVLGYISEDPKAPEGHVLHASAEPKTATVPRDGGERFTVVVEGVAADKLAHVWSDLCQPSGRPVTADFIAVYPHMTTFQGNRFRFRGGDPRQVRECLERLLHGALNNGSLKVYVER